MSALVKEFEEIEIRLINESIYSGFFDRILNQAKTILDNEQ